MSDRQIGKAKRRKGDNQVMTDEDTAAMSNVARGSGKLLVALGTKGLLTLFSASLDIIEE